MNENYQIGIDLGSKNIKIVWATLSSQNNSYKILAKMTYPSSGLSFGYITNKKELSNSLREAIKNFHQKYKIDIKNAFVSIDGYGLKSENITIIQPTANKVINSFDLQKVEEKSEKLLKKKTDNQVIHREIVSYSVDGFEQFDNPEGLIAKRLEVNLFFLTAPQNILTNLEDVFEDNNIIIDDFIPSFLSLSKLSLQEIDKKLGSLLIDYGSEKTSVLLMEKNKPKNYFVLKLGSKKITEKIMISEKINFAEAEKLKKSTIKNARVNKIIKEELILLAQEINKILKKWEKSGILPGGITVTGGGSKVNILEDIFRKEIGLPIKRSVNKELDEFHIAYGNIIIGTIATDSDLDIFSSIKNIFKPILKIFNFLKL